MSMTDRIGTKRPGMVRKGSRKGTWIVRTRTGGGAIPVVFLTAEEWTN
jgi:hypothetical protein